MKTLRTSAPLKFLAGVLCVLLSGIAFWSCAVTMSNWDDLWSGGDFYHSYSIYKPISSYRNLVYELMDLRMQQEWYGKLSYSDQKRLEAIQESLAPENTNFRYQVHEQDTSALLDDTMGALADSDSGLTARERWITTITLGDRYRYYDYQSESRYGGPGRLSDGRKRGTGRPGLRGPIL